MIEMVYRSTFNSPSADPLEGYFPIADLGARFVALDCDFCDRNKADLSTSEGWPICQDCAEERH